MSKCFEGIGFQIDFIEKINAGPLTEHDNMKVIAVDYELHSNVIKKIESNIQQFGETNSKALILFYNIPKPENIPPSKTLDHAYYLGTSFSEEELFKIMAEGNIILNSEKSEPFLQ